MIEVRKKDLNFKFEVLREKGGDALLRCFACGTCTVSCPVRAVDERYNPRKIIRMTILGMKEEVLKNEFIWLCAGCYSCYERCPQDVRLTDIMTALRNIAVREGYIPEGVKLQIENLKKFGRLYEVDDFIARKREKANLPQVEREIADIKKILER